MQLTIKSANFGYIKGRFVWTVNGEMEDGETTSVILSPVDALRLARTVATDKNNIPYFLNVLKNKTIDIEVSTRDILVSATPVEEV